MLRAGSEITEEELIALADSCEDAGDVISSRAHRDYAAVLHRIAEQRKRADVENVTNPHTYYTNGFIVEFLNYIEKGRID